ncbi:MAG: DsrE family protein [Pirellulaceae bacterium]|nr:DsrE family protein [Pirellulaceae bacterium]
MRRNICWLWSCWWLGSVLLGGLLLNAVRGDEPRSLAGASEPEWEYPLIQGAGGIRPLPRAAEPPRAGTAVVFDITRLEEPGKVVAGIDRMARLLNLYAAGGVDVRQARFALVLHGDATVAALGHDAFRRHTKVEQNPNLRLLAEFRKLGVEVYVCGQALAHKRFAHDDVAGELTVAVSAMNVLINKQQAGAAYLPFH